MKKKFSILQMVGVLKQALEFSGSLSCAFQAISFASSEIVSCRLRSPYQTLDDWRWFGSSEEMPPWYTGKPWS